MKRLPGVIVSAVFLILGSLFQLILAFGMALAGVIEHSQAGSGIHSGAVPAVPIPAWMPIFMYVMCAFFVALAAWGIMTSVGLFRIRRWARYSMLVIGGCLALMGLPAMLIALATFAMPMALPPTVNASQAPTVHAMTGVVMGLVAVFYGIMAAVGISWLVYFNLRKVRELFSGAPEQIAESRRPFLISVVAVLSIFGAVSCALMAFVPFPGAFLGMVLYGWQRAALYLVYAVLLGAAGVGLWQLEEWGRRLSLGMQAVGLLQYIVLITRPSLMTRYSGEINRAMNLKQPQASMQFPGTFYILVFGIGILFLFAIIWILIHYRDAFRPNLAPPQSESPALP